MGRRALSGPPEDDYQHPTAWRYPQLRADIRRQVFLLKEHVSLLTIDDTAAQVLGIPAQWVYLVRVSEPLPDVLIPDTYWKRCAEALRVKGRPRIYGPPPGTSTIPLEYHYRYLTTERPARCMSIIAFSHSQPRNYKPLPSPFLHPTTYQQAPS
jgi:hypothetical protein